MTEASVSPEAGVGHLRWTVAEGYIPATVPARRTRHVRFNDLEDPEPVQHTRLDSRQAESALLSTMAYPVSGT